MKKSLIAAAGATLAVAAMPAVGVFAATSGSFIDTLTVTVNGGCTMESSATAAGVYADRSFSGSVDAGTAIELNGGTTQTGATMTISCNATGTAWKVTAVADGLTGSGDAANASIEPGAVTTGDTSGWAIKSHATGASSNPYENYKAYEEDSQGAHYTTFLTGTTGGTAATFNPSYQVYASPTQKPGNYGGTVVYTIGLNS